MSKSPINRLWLFAPALFLSITILSCNSTRKIKYFQDIADSGQVKQIPKAAYVEPLIQPGDILTIQVQTIDASASAINAGNIASSVNTPSASGATNGAGGLSSILASMSGGTAPDQSATGYLVDNDGNIEMLTIGKVKAAGSTIFQLKDTLSSRVAKYYKGATVSVRFANFKVNVIGEVLKPGEYTLSNERTSILDAISMAGDLTIFAKRENILLVRENQDGSKTAYRVNLKKSDIMSSPVFYLKQNDLIYVEPRKAKSDATDAAQQKYFSIAAAVLSVLIIVGTRIK